VSNRLVAAGAVAIALLALGTVVLPLRGERSPKPHPSGEGTGAGAPGTPAPSSTPLVRAGGLPAATGERSAGIAAAGESSTAPARPVPAPEDVDPSWRESRVAYRLREIGPVATYVYAGLKSAREEMKHCFEAGAAEAGAARAGAAETGPDAESSPAVLVLYVEERDGAIDVVDVRVDRLGTSPPGLVECCRDVLRGHEILAPNAVPGRRYRLPFRVE
jgi:hypothetical protein